MNRITAQLRGIRARIANLRLQLHFTMRRARFGTDLTLIGSILPYISNQGKFQVGNALTLRCITIPLEFHIGAYTSLEIGDQCFINQGTTISTNRSIRIGAHALIGEYVAIHDSHFHQVHPGQPTRTEPIVIEQNVWIGHRAIILGGVTIGAHSVIGAGAVVTRNIPPKSIATGSPARVVSQFECDDDWIRT